MILDMKTSGWMDVKKWILSFGAEAELLEPQKLREDMRNTINATIKRY